MRYHILNTVERTPLHHFFSAAVNTLIKVVIKVRDLFCQMFVQFLTLLIRIGVKKNFLAPQNVLHSKMLCMPCADVSS